MDLLALYSRPQPRLVLDQGSEMAPWLLGLPIRLKLFTHESTAEVLLFCKPITGHAER
jgi:hypothetical protein